MRLTTMQRQRFLYAALGLLTLWRWALLPTLDLAPEEAEAVFAIKHGEWGGFFGLGALVQFFARLGTLIWGVNEVGVRFFAPLLALAASLAVWRLARDLFDAVIAGWTVVIVNVLPAFNLAAVTLTPATVACALAPAAALCLRHALQQTDPLHRAWGAVAACVALAQPPAFAMMAAVTGFFALPGRLRHHLHGVSFRIIAGAWAVVVLSWLIWQDCTGWPVMAEWRWLPEWRLLPNLLRWLLLASPLLLVLLVLSVLAGFTPSMLISHRRLPMAMLLPLAVVDFFYGPHTDWPDAGGSAWMLFAAMLLAHRAAVTQTPEIEQKISLRTIAVVLAALQSAFLLQTDLPRTLGFTWSFSSDPSRTMRGWRESARVVSAVLQQAGGAEGKWFVLAADRPLAVELDHYLGRTEPVQTAGSDLRSFAGRSALYVTEGRELPEGLKKQFQRTEVLSVARVMHAGNEVRGLKIFACHDYRPPDL
ncbi:glycosyltransferase family 39 protein [Prosthecobacter sp.]|uniref:glycosyltransferase family 39 protein n=1 Tax=Prosthecobacter sp. TaxID=1965333 RepID=UPI00378308BE